MRVFLFAAAIAVSTSAFAADPAPPVTEGQMLRDAHDVRLGNIQDVNSNGTVDIIIDSQDVQVPIATIKIVDGKAVTSMTKAQLTAQ